MNEFKNQQAMAMPVESASLGRRDVDVSTLDMVSDMLRRKVPGVDMRYIGANAYVGFDPAFLGEGCSLRRFVFLEHDGCIGACIAESDDMDLMLFELPEYAGAGLEDEFVSGSLLFDLFPYLSVDEPEHVALPNSSLLRWVPGRIQQESERVHAVRALSLGCACVLRMTQEILGVDRRGPSSGMTVEELTKTMMRASYNFSADEMHDGRYLHELAKMGPLEQERLWDYLYRNVARCCECDALHVSASEIACWMEAETGASGVSAGAIRACLEVLGVLGDDDGLCLDESCVAFHRWMMRLLDDPSAMAAEPGPHDFENDLIDPWKEQDMETTEKLDCTRYTVHMDDGEWHVTKVVDPVDGTLGWYYRHADYGPADFAFGISADGGAAFSADEDAVSQIADEFFDGYREEHMNA